MAEATARGHYFDKENAETVWNDWFKTFFKHIDDNLDVIRAVSYINADWDSQDMWDGWGQTKLEGSCVTEFWAIRSCQAAASKAGAAGHRRTRAA